MCIKLNFVGSVTISPTLESIHEPIGLFEEFLRNFEISSKDRMLWSLSLTEVLANSIRYGSDRVNGDMIHIHWKHELGRVSVTITDKGTGPWTGLIETPSLPEDLEAESGRGLFIVNSFVDVWLHRKSIEGYRQTLIKLIY